MFKTITQRKSNKYSETKYHSTNTVSLTIYAATESYSAVKFQFPLF